MVPWCKCLVHVTADTTPDYARNLRLKVAGKGHALIWWWVLHSNVVRRPDLNSGLFQLRVNVKGRSRLAAFRDFQCRRSPPYFAKHKLIGKMMALIARCKHVSGFNVHPGKIAPWIDGSALWKPKKMIDPTLNCILSIICRILSLACKGFVSD